jgi:hypothetical protein
MMQIGSGSRRGAGEENFYSMETLTLINHGG